MPVSSSKLSGRVPPSPTAPHDLHTSCERSLSDAKAGRVESLDDHVTSLRERIARMKGAGPRA